MLQKKLRAHQSCASQRPWLAGAHAAKTAQTSKAQDSPAPSDAAASKDSLGSIPDTLATFDITSLSSAIDLLPVIGVDKAMEIVNLAPLVSFYMFLTIHTPH